MQVSIVKNTATNYLVILIRLFQGIYVTRWLINFLGQEKYGLWSLLWTFFGYAILVDFGFGISAQKFTSFELFKRDIKHYNSIVSMIFSFQMLMSIVIMLGAFAASFFLPELFKIDDPAKLAYCAKCFYVFAFGSALIFPLCIFSEIITGLHKIYVKNFIDTGSRIVELIGFLTILKCGGGLLGLVIFDVILMGVERCVTGFCVSRMIPGFRIRFHLDKQVFREIAGFASGTYFVSMGHLLKNRTSRPIISSFCGLPQVGIFHLSGRLADMCSQAIGQYNNNVRPISAQLFHRGKIAMLRKFIMKAIQWNMFMCCLILVPAIVLSDAATWALFNSRPTPQIHLLSILFLVASWLTFSGRQIPSSLLIMSERHHLLARITMGEAIAAILLNILFLSLGFGVECVLYISIGLNLLIVVAIMFPVMLSMLKQNLFSMLWHVYCMPLLCTIPCVFVLLEVKKTLSGSSMDAFWLCAVCGMTYAVLYLIISWFFLIKQIQRKKLLNRIRGRVRGMLRGERS